MWRWQTDGSLNRKTPISVLLLLWWEVISSSTLCSSARRPSLGWDVSGKVLRRFIATSPRELIIKMNSYIPVWVRPRSLWLGFLWVNRCISCECLHPSYHLKHPLESKGRTRFFEVTCWKAVSSPQTNLPWKLHKQVGRRGPVLLLVIETSELEWATSLKNQQIVVLELNSLEQ